MKEKKGKIIGIIVLLIVLAMTIAALVLISGKPEPNEPDDIFTNSYMTQTEPLYIQETDNYEYRIIPGIDF